jgi:hypothetical protein
MGWSEDLLAEGLLTEGEYEYMEELGSRARMGGDPTAIRYLEDIAWRAGLDELATELDETYTEAVTYYLEKYDYRYWYDEEVRRWRDVETGRFVSSGFEAAKTVQYDYLRAYVW